MRNVSLLLALTCLAAASFAGCATESLLVEEVRSPSRIDIARYSPVAVDDLRGEGGVDVAEDLTVSLTALSRSPGSTGAEGLHVLDRRYLDRALRELGRSRGDEWDPDAIVRLGRLVGAHCLIHGRVSAHDYAEETHQERWTDSEGRPHIDYTLRARGTVVGYFQVSEVETGRILVAEKLERTSVAETRATDRRAPSIDSRELLRRSREAVVGELMRAIAPYEVTVDVELFVDSEIPRLRHGNDYARLGDWAEARELYLEALRGLGPELRECRYKVLYNLGVALAYLDRFGDALGTLKEAYALRKDPLILAQLERTRRRRDGWAAIGGART